MASTIALKNEVHVEFSAGKEIVVSDAAVIAADGWLIISQMDAQGQLIRSDAYPPHTIKRVWFERRPAVKAE